MVFSTRFIAPHHDPDTFLLLLCFSTLCYDSLRYPIRWKNFHSSAARSVTTILIAFHALWRSVTLLQVRFISGTKLYALHCDLQGLFSVMNMNALYTGQKSLGSNSFKNALFGQSIINFRLYAGLADGTNFEIVNHLN